MENVRVGDADVYQEPKDVLVELAALRAEMVVLAQLVSSVNATHPPIV